MDFNKLEEENQMNPTGSKESSYRVKWRKKEQKFEIAPELMEEMGLLDNSLVQLNDAPTKQIYLAVFPGNSGKWFKSIPGKAKGIIRKNKKLHDKLEAFGFTSEQLDFVLQEGTYKDNPVWKIVELGVTEKKSKEAVEATETPEEVNTDDTAQSKAADNASVEEVEEEVENLSAESEEEENVSF